MNFTSRHNYVVGARRRLGIAPAGNTSPSDLAPGNYTLTFGATFANGQRRGNAAQVASLFDQAATALGVRGRASGAAAFSGINTPGQMPRGVWSLPITITAASGKREVQRAFARAIYWSTDHIEVNTGNVLPKNSLDGGASIVAIMDAQPGSFIASPTGGPAATPATPGTGDSIVAIGGPGRMSAQDLLASLCGKAPKGESALASVDIAAFQAGLERIGLSTQGVDGTIGPNTRAAVQAFQTRYGITSAGQSGFGTLGPQTQAAIIRAICQGQLPTASVPSPAAPPAPTMPLPSTPASPVTVTPPRPSPAAPAPGPVATPGPLATVPPPPPVAEASMFGSPWVIGLGALGLGAVVYLATTPKKKGSAPARG